MKKNRASGLGPHYQQCPYLNPKFTKAYAFLKNLHSKIKENYEYNSFIESFNFLSSQIETEERNQIQDPFSCPKAFYEENALRVVPQKAILESSIIPTESLKTTSKQESSENEDSQVEQQDSMPQNQQIPFSQNQSFGFMPQQMNINPDQNNFAYIQFQQIPHLATDFISGLALNQQRRQVLYRLKSCHNNL